LVTFFLVSGCVTNPPRSAGEGHHLSYPIACAPEASGKDEGERVHYPIAEECKTYQKPCFDCKTAFFFRPEAVAPRDPNTFPKRYLELWDPKVRELECDREHAAQECPGTDRECRADCEQRLQALSEYFESGDQPPGPDRIGVALEGGGSKSAAFTLGVLAGLEELKILTTKVGAIASVSGGSYAASYYFNRLYDFYREGENTVRVPKDTTREWFRSCIPDYFLNKNIAAFSSDLPLSSTRELPNCGELESSSSRTPHPFKAEYKYIGHVWSYHDLLLLDNEFNYRTSDSWRPKEVANLAVLSLATVATVPFQFLGGRFFAGQSTAHRRSRLMRWALNANMVIRPMSGRLHARGQLPFSRTYSSGVGIEL